MVTHSLSIFAHRVGTHSNAPRHAFAKANRQILTFQSHGRFRGLRIFGHRQDPAAQPGKTNKQVKHRAPRMHCGAAQLTHHQNKHVDYIIKTKSLRARNNYMIIVMLSTTVLTLQCILPVAILLFVSCNMRWIALNHIIFHAIIHLIRTVNCFPTSDGQHTER